MSRAPGSNPPRGWRRCTPRRPAAAAATQPPARRRLRPAAKIMRRPATSPTCVVIWHSTGTPTRTSIRPTARQHRWGYPSRRSSARPPAVARSVALVAAQAALLNLLPIITTFGVIAYATFPSTVHSRDSFVASDPAATTTVAMALRNALSRRCVRARGAATYRCGTSPACRASSAVDRPHRGADLDAAHVPRCRGLRLSSAQLAMPDHVVAQVTDLLLTRLQAE